MNRREHYLESERMIQTVLDGSAATVGEIMSREQAERIQATFAMQIALAQVHATLATVPSRWIAGESYQDEHDAVAAESMVNTAMDLMKDPLPSAGTLQMPAIMWTNDERDTPKMIEETLNVCEAALTVYENSGVSSDFVDPHRERVARLIEAAQRGVQ